MVAYVIVLQEGPVRDREAMAEYHRQTRAHAQEFASISKIEPLVIYGQMEALEGAPPEGVVILKFPNIAQAMAWYQSPAYQAALPNRLRAADYRTFIVEGASLEHRPAQEIQ